MMFWLYNETKLISKYSKFPPLKLLQKILTIDSFCRTAKTINKVMVRNGFAKKEEANHFRLNLFAFDVNKKTLE